MNPAALWRRWVALFEEEEGPDEPRYDPVHLTVVLVATQVVIGALFWLLWTLFVYEGGLPSKVGPFLSVVLGGKRLADYGWTGAPDRQGLFEGWLGNLAALALTALVVVVLQRADARHARRAKR